MKRRKPTHEVLAYTYIAKRGWVKSRDVAGHLGIDHNCAIQALMRLEGKGCVIKTGFTHTRRYAATGSPPPDDMRGLSPGSLAALIPRPKSRALRIPTPRAAIALEQAWGWLPVGCEETHANAA